MVTHNPNIAVVCDAEQIIHAASTARKAIDYLHERLNRGPDINKHSSSMCSRDTRPAFDNRDAKYFAQ